jgi:DNA-binding Lrp family transcriptional regulator
MPETVAAAPCTTNRSVINIFVKVKSDSTQSLDNAITNKIRKISGISSTVILVFMRTKEEMSKGSSFLFYS